MLDFIKQHCIFVVTVKDFVGLIFLAVLVLIVMLVRALTFIDWVKCMFFKWKGRNK
jgi:hypothetical protein